MKLVIISHTEHYRTKDGTLVGWGPTVNEVNHLLAIFDTIYHVAMLHEGDPPPSALPYSSKRIIFVPLKPLGGKTILSKLLTLMYAPSVLSSVSKTLKKVDCFQLRTPTGMGVYLIPYATFFVKKKGWFKYAGNWNQKHAPIGYSIQRWLLKKQNRIVTINGTWTKQPKHHLSFENPCLTDQDIENGKLIRKKKVFEGALSFCFVGRLEKEKGVERIIKAFNTLNKEEVTRVSTVHFVGEGDELEYFKKLSKESNIHFIFHGALSRTDVFEIYKDSHVFLLPTTASEGFPKVIAEAMNFGCVPIVSNISAIGHYIKDNYNGFLIEPVTIELLNTQLKNVLYLSDTVYKQYMGNASKIVNLFTFSHYIDRIESEILKE